MAALSLRDISKAFGAAQVIENLSLDLADRGVFGFIGKNGAGKTTTMKLILGLLALDKGEIYVCGERVRYGETPTNKYIGYLPDVPEFYGFMTAAEYLILCGKIRGLKAWEAKVRAEEALSFTGLEEAADRRIKGFSRGMKQRLGIAQALIHRPKILICDEPTSALDPAGRKEILDILAALGNEATVLFSSHILGDVERICQNITLIHKGKIVLSGSREELKAKRGADGFELEFSHDREAKAALNILSRSHSLQGSVLALAGDERDMAAAIERLKTEEVFPRRAEMREPTLESLFMEATAE
ncbi:MAG: ABC transporter ATP-binding protein [Bacillota bacterium]|nr:ABC transporter ATP-binding protein [Bacillota bacterium]